MAVHIAALLQEVQRKGHRELRLMVQRLRHTAGPVVCQRSAVAAVAAAAVARPKLVQRVLVTEILVLAAESAEKVAKELPMQPELVRQSCTALAEVARDTGKIVRVEQTPVAVAVPTQAAAQVLTELMKLVVAAVPVGAAELLAKLLVMVDQELLLFVIQFQRVHQ